MKKFLVSIMSFALLLTLFAFDNSAYAGSTGQGAPNLDESEELKAMAEKYEAIIMELDGKLNMYDLESHTSSDLDSLSPEALEFYYLYKEAQLEKSQSGENQLLVSDKKDTLKSSVVTAAALPNIGGVKNYYLSNQQVKDITNLVDLHGTGWAFAIAIAKKFAKSPTYLTMLVIAVPALGSVVLKNCNRLGKGVVIKDTRIGTMHSFTCFSR